MDQEFKPIEDIKPITISTPNETIQSDIESQTVEIATPVEAIQAIEIEKPIEAVLPVIEMPSHESPKKGSGKTIFTILLIIVLIAAGAGAYWWRDKTATESLNSKATEITALNTKVKNLETELAAANETIADTTVCTDTAPSSATIENIKASITSANTAALEGYMATSVKVVLAASEGTGLSTPTQAVSSISDFISTATAPWNFALASTILTQYAAGSYGTYFPSIAVVGASANNKLISFDFDCNGKISTVFIAASQSILQ